MPTFIKISWKNLISADKEPDILRNNQSLYEDNLQPQIALTYTQEVINFCEKLHSYFHFEQAFFHLKLAEQLLSVEECDAAIQQEPFNSLAFKMKNTLLNSVSLNDLEDYARPHKNYQDFLIFLGLNPDFSDYAKGSYWDYYDQYLLNGKIENLHLSKNDVKNKHQNYHEEAAKAYYNRALAFQNLDQKLLAKNDLVKVKNLNPFFPDALLKILMISMNFE